MSVSKFLFGENTPLLQLEKFSQTYKLSVENTFLMGSENPPVSLKTISDIVLGQEKEGDFLYNTIELLNITGETEDDMMKPFLLQSLALSDISRNLFVKRNLNGKILSVERKEDLWKDWEIWKKNKLKSVFPDEKDQDKFTINYENGLKDFETAFKKNLQYLLLMPEIYSLIFPPNHHYSFLYSPLKFNSRLVDGMEYVYQMKLVKLDEEKDLLSVELHSVLNNREELDTSHLKEIYSNQKDFSIEDFGFSIKIKYVLEKTSAKIKSAELYFSEKLHNHLTYSVKIGLHEFVDEF